MRRALILGAVVTAGFWFFGATADAGDKWGVNFGIGNHGVYLNVGYRHGHGKKHYKHYKHYRKIPHYRHYPRPVHRVRHVHVRTPIYKQVWEPPIYRTVLAGYDVYGNPVYNRVLVRHGYHRRIICGYRCTGCGVHF